MNGRPNQRYICEQCQEHAAQPQVLASCASVGMSHGISTGDALDQYIAAFHDHGHRWADVVSSRGESFGLTAASEEGVRSGLTGTPAKAASRADTPDSEAAAESGSAGGGENPHAARAFYEEGPRFTIWYALWQIEQEAESQMRFGGDAESTLDFIKDRAECARKDFEEFTA